MKRVGYMIYAILVVVVVTMINLGGQSNSSGRSWSVFVQPIATVRSPCG